MEEDMYRFTFLRDSLHWEYATKLRLFTRRSFWFSQRIYTFSGMFYITFPQFMDWGPFLEAPGNYRAR